MEQGQKDEREVISKDYYSCSHNFFCKMHRRNKVLIIKIPEPEVPNLLLCIHKITLKYKR
jgi:hypothetical protein